MRWMAGAVCAALVLSCGDDSGDDKRAESLLGFDDGASGGETKTVVIDRAAASISMSTGASLSFPEGALRERTSITMTRIADREALPLAARVSASQQAASAPYRITPHGLVFVQLSELTLPINRGDASRVRMMKLDNDEDTTWEVVQTRAGAGRMTAALNGLSVYMLVEDLTAPPAADAGMDAGGGGANEAGAQPNEAGAISEAGSYDESDAAKPPTGERLLAKLQACSQVASPGKLTDPIDPAWLVDKRFRCSVECWVGASCEEFLTYSTFCGASSHVQSIADCTEACFGRSFITDCMDVTGAPISANACDGVSECAQGEDEAGCGPIYRYACADGEKLDYVDARCDGSRDCTDGSDELNCPAPFQCTDGSTTAAKFVCDLDKDCADGSDEMQGCLQVACPPAQ